MSSLSPRSTSGRGLFLEMTLFSEQFTLLTS